MSMIRRRVLTGLAAGFGLMLVACTQPAETNTAPDAAPTMAAPTVIYLVRHAEKTAERPDPELTEAGKARAEALADRLEDADLTAIFSSDYIRTRDTAAPIAARTGLDVQTYDASDMSLLADLLKIMDGNILVSGHSNTTPELVDLLGGDYVSPIVEAGENDRLYIVTLSKGGTATSVLERYGVPFVPAEAE